VKVAIHQPHYLPWLGYLAKWAAADVFIFLDTVQYEKNGWQNRNRIKTHTGPAWLTVPVHAPFGTAIRDVRVDRHQPWARRHLRAIEHAYAEAPCFGRFRDGLAALYAAEWETLAPLAVSSARWLATALGIPVPTRLASELGAADGLDATARLVALCQAVGADTYLAGRDGITYMDPAPFEAAGIAVRCQAYDHPAYPQRHGVFVPALSGVDLLLNLGEAGGAVLQSGDRWTPPGLSWRP
jgi:hypothetical protein